MSPEQIKFIRDNKTIAAIVTTRNAAFWLVDAKGQGGPGARYEVVEWDDINELVTLRNDSNIRGDQFNTLQVISYGPIDEMICMEQP